MTMSAATTPQAATETEQERTRLLKNARPGQRLAFLTVNRHIERGKKRITVVLPTRYGKSDLARLLAWWLKKERRIHTTLVLSPNKTLRSQIAAKDKIAAFLKRFPVFGGFRVMEITGRIYNPGSNGEDLLSATIQTIQRNIDDWRQWVINTIARYGVPPLIIVDESHTGSESNQWGDAINELVEAGAIVVLMTATPDRADGRVPYGFDHEVIAEQDTTVWISKPNEQPELVTIEKWSATRRKIRLIPDVEVTFAEAWREKPSPLCIVGLVPFDVELWRMDKEEFTEGDLLSKLEDNQLRRGGLLGKIVKNDRVIRQAAMGLVQALTTFKTTTPDCAAIVFCGNDDDPEKKVNQHAKQIEQAILDIDPSLKVIIATSTVTTDDDEGDDTPADKRITQFAKGNGDVLIVKQMASLGLDIERLKVGLDLSPTRTFAATVQRLMRVATPYGYIKHGVWITPADVLSIGIFKLLVGDKAIIERSDWRTSLDNLLRSYTKERDEGDEYGPIFGVNDARPADFHDTHGNHAEAKLLAGVEALFAALPALIAMTSHSEAAQRLHALGITVTQEQQSEVVDMTQEVRDYKDKIAALCRAIIMQRLNGHYSQEGYRRESDRLWNDVIYPTRVIPPGVRYTAVADLGILKGVEQLLTKVNGGPVE